MISEMSNQPDTGHFDSSRGFKGRFSWVKRLIQSRSNSSSTVSSQRRIAAANKNHPKSHQHERHQRVNKTPAVSNNPFHEESPSESPNNQYGSSVGAPPAPPPTHSNQQQRNQQLITRFDLSSETDNGFDIDPSINQSVKTSSKTPSITHDSINTRTDNISTLPVISMSTMSARSSTFSEHSGPSTSGTILSDHPTVYTNASTVGIPPASIMDRRERLHHPISLNNYHLTGNNNSSHTVNTATSPTSAIPNEYSTDMSSLKS